LISRGYKAGGFNPSLARALGGDDDASRASVVFDPEHLVNFELGVKGLWLDGRLSAQAGGFYMDRQDMQLRSSAQFTDNPNDFIFITSNAEGHSWGFEATADWQLNDQWRLHGAVGLLSSAIDAYELEREPGIPGDLVGRDFAHAPPWTLNLGASYAGQGGWVGRIDFSAAGSYYFDYSHDEKSDKRRIVNLRFGREWTHWALYGWVRNVFDEDYYTRGFYFGLEPPDFPSRRYTRLGDPRHYGLTLTFRH
jgi:outer membrane receptor protein involved in Fe transport